MSYYDDFDANAADERTHQTRIITVIARCLLLATLGITLASALTCDPAERANRVFAEKEAAAANLALEKCQRAIAE